MKSCLVLSFMLVMGGAGVSTCAAADIANLAAEVRATEIAFAKTLADRDLAAFRRMIAPDAIFLGQGPLRGVEAIAADWAKFFDGAEAPFSWAPEIVEVQEGGQLALSTGPVMNPEGKRVGTFTSIWRREPGGEWRVIFDRGCPACDCGKAKPAQ